MSKTVRNKLDNHRGRFVSLLVKRASGQVAYSAKVRRITDKSVVIADQNAGGRLVTIPLANIVG